MHINKYINYERMKVIKSSGILKIIHHERSYLLLFGKQK